MIFGSRFLIPSSGYGRDCRISSCVIEGRLQGPGGSPSARGFWLPQWAFYMPGFLNIRFLTIYQISLSAIFSGFFSQVKSMNLQRLLRSSKIFSESHLLFARLFYFPTFFTVNIRCRWYSMHTVSRHGTAHLFHAPDPLLSIAHSLEDRDTGTWRPIPYC